MLLSLTGCYYSHFLFCQCLQATCTLLAAQACVVFGWCSCTKTHGVWSFSYSVLYPIFSVDLKIKLSIPTSYPLKKLKVRNINPSTSLVWSYICVCIISEGSSQKSLFEYQNEFSEANFSYF